jgi:hypothetical protein
VYPASYARRPRRLQSLPWFPAGFRHADICFLNHPVPADRSAFLAVCFPAPKRWRPTGFHVPHDSDSIGVGAISTPGPRCPHERLLNNATAEGISPSALLAAGELHHLPSNARSRSSHQMVCFRSPVRSLPCPFLSGESRVLRLFP